MNLKITLYIVFELCMVKKIEFFFSYKLNINSGIMSSNSDVKIDHTINQYAELESLDSDSSTDSATEESKPLQEDGWEGDGEWEDVPVKPGKQPKETDVIEKQDEPKINSKDLDQPFLNVPVSGSFNHGTFRKVLNLLVANIVGKKIPETTAEKQKLIFDYMSKQKYAPIRRKGKVIHDFKTRTCKRKTFGKAVVAGLGEILMPQIVKKLEALGKHPVDIKLHPTHGDILFYTKGGFFNQHRDTALEHDFKDTHQDTTWNCYSFLMGIDTNIDKHSEDGNTNVYLLPGDTVEYIHDAVDYHYQYYDIPSIMKGRSLFKHSFPHSRLPSNWVMFDANALHASIPIQEEGKFKLALKLDVWCSELAETTKKPYQCCCGLCQPRLLNKKTLYTGVLEKNGCVPDVMKKILTMYTDEPRKLCIRDPTTKTHEEEKCTCLDCISGYMEYDEEYYDHDYDDDYDRNDDYYYDDYDDCNGYCHADHSDRSY